MNARIRMRRIALTSVLALLGSGVVALANDASVLRVKGMTFVGSKGSVNELILRARYATFSPDESIARLEDVRATVEADDQGQGFAMTCERGELNLDTNDFLAEGNVKGVTGDGQHYSAPWVRYDHAKGMLYTDAPVTMVDLTGTFRGDGFRYYVREGRFKLLGNVSVEQGP